MKKTHLAIFFFDTKNRFHPCIYSMGMSITYPPSSPPWGKIKGLSGEEDWLEWISGQDHQGAGPG